MKLKGAKADAAGQSRKLSLKLSGATAKKLRKSGAKQGRVSVKVVATDQDGNETTKRDSTGLSKRG